MWQSCSFFLSSWSGSPPMKVWHRKLGMALPRLFTTSQICMAISRVGARTKTWKQKRKVHDTAQSPFNFKGAPVKDHPAFLPQSGLAFSFTPYKTLLSQIDFFYPWRRYMIRPGGVPGTRKKNLDPALVHTNIVLKGGQVTLLFVLKNPEKYNNTAK